MVNMNTNPAGSKWDSTAPSKWDSTAPSKWNSTAPSVWSNSSASSLITPDPAQPAPAMSFSAAAISSISSAVQANQIQLAELSQRVLLEATRGNTAKVDQVLDDLCLTTKQSNDRIMQSIDESIAASQEVNKQISEQLMKMIEDVSK